MHSFRISLSGGFDSRLTDVRNGSSAETVAPFYASWSACRLGRADPYLGLLSHVPDFGGLQSPVQGL
jgi:hypothetical protein